MFHWLNCSHASLFFFFNDTATTEIYTLSLHDALPIYMCRKLNLAYKQYKSTGTPLKYLRDTLLDSQFILLTKLPRSEEHTSELQSHSDLVCRLLLEKKKKTIRL